MSTLARRGALCAVLLFVATAQAGDGSCERWRQWQEFKGLYLSEDGRVIDASTPQAITVSEGQAYAMIFALIANDPATFVKILRWTQDNMAGGNLARSLPAWKWGRAEDGRWSVLDRNPAADADLWMTYALAQGARLWHNAGYAQLAHAMAELILREEVSLIPGLGATLLPGAKGFVAQQTWRLNASYAPIEVLRALERSSDERQWAAVLESSQRVIAASAPRGFAADWILYRESGGFSADATTAGVGSYNAIRVYLWAGMLAEGDPQAASLPHQSTRTPSRHAARLRPASWPRCCRCSCTLNLPTRFKPTASASKPSRSRTISTITVTRSRCSDWAGSRAASASIDTVSCTFHGPVRAAPPDRCRGAMCMRSGSGRGSDLAAGRSGTHSQRAFLGGARPGRSGAAGTEETGGGAPRLARGAAGVGRIGSAPQ